MNILVICQYYQPEPFRISDICEELVRRGHQITVVTGVPNYPMGKTYAGYRFGKKRHEYLNGVIIHRCFTIARRTGAIWRFANYFSYAFSSALFVTRLKDDYDVVLVNQLSPVMMAQAGLKYKKKHGKKLLLYCLDLWPESLVAGGIRRGSFLYGLFRRVSEKIYTQADRIFITSRMFRGYLKNEFHITDEHIAYLPQYAESIFLLNKPSDAQKDTIDLVFAGNIGSAQCVPTILRAARLLHNVPELRWHIVGDGSDLDNCRKLTEELGLANVIFHGRKPVDDMPAFYAMADALLVTMQDDPILSLTLPGKVQSYMAAGKPVIGAINGETAEVIRDAGCGYCAKAEDAEGLAEIVKQFIESTEKAALGENALSYYKANFTREHFFEVIEDELAFFSLVKSDEELTYNKDEFMKR